MNVFRAPTGSSFIAYSIILCARVGQAYSPPTRPCVPSCAFGKVCFGGGNCDKRRHLGTDYDACPGQVVLAPVTGTVVEAAYRDGYGGEVLIETSIDGEPAVAVIGHMLCDKGCLSPTAEKCNAYRPTGGVYPCDALKVAKGQAVVAGESRLGVVGPSHQYQNGSVHYTPHVHVGIRRGAYTNTWKYYGYAVKADTCNAEQIEANWFDPETLISSCSAACEEDVGKTPGGLSSFYTNSFLAKYNTLKSNIGCPVEVESSTTRFVHDFGGRYLQDFCQTDGTKDYPSSADGLTALVLNGNAAYLLKEGFWGTYKCLTDLAGPKLLGPPTGDERQIVVGSFKEGSRQDFIAGHMWWGPCQTGSGFVFLAKLRG